MIESKEKKLHKLMKLTQAGNRSSYQELLQELNLIAKKYIQKRISSFDKADDIVQEILLSVHKSKHTYNPENLFLPWFYAISNYRLNDYLKKYYNNKENLSFDDGFEAIISSDNINSSVEKEQIIQKALSVLSDKNKQVVELMYIEGYSVKETAEKMNISESDAKVSAHRALKKIKSTFKDYRYEK